MTDVVIFQPLPQEALRSIVELEIKKLQDRLNKKEIFISLTAEAKEFLVQKGYQPEMGARPLRRVIEQYVEDPLSELLLQRPDQSWRSEVVLQGEKLIFIDKDFTAKTKEKEVREKELKEREKNKQTKKSSKTGA